jgi:hypothetical protein
VWPERKRAEHVEHSVLLPSGPGPCERRTGMAG